MRKLALVLLLGAAVAFTPAVAQADPIAVGDTVTVTDVTSGAYSGNGSVPTGGGGTWWLNNITQGATHAFMTFCIELDEHIELGVNFVVGSIEDYAVGGGAGAVGGKDYLDQKTKALYHYFRTASPAFSGEDLQMAFWHFEEGVSASNAAITWANDHAAGYDFGGYAVKALNLNYVTGAPAQSLLTMVPTTVPDGGMTLMLLGGALMGLGALRRKFRG